MIFDLKKPIYGSYFGIWKKWIDIAKKRDLNMIVNSPFGKSTYKVKDWLKGAKKMERYYKNPEVPMIFYGREIAPDIVKREERKAEEKKVDRIVEDWTPQGRLKLFQALKKVLKK